MDECSRFAPLISQIRLETLLKWLVGLADNKTSSASPGWFHLGYYLEKSVESQN